MIPFRDVIPSRTTPLVTLGLIAANVAVFLPGLALSPSALGDIQFAWGLVPAEFSGWRLVTSLFLHDGWIHLISNLWALWLFGDNVEDRLGHGRYLIFLLLTATAAALVEVWASPHSLFPILGASGAIAGVIGAYVALYPRSRVLVIVPRFFSIDVIEAPAVAFAGIWLATQLLLTLGRLGDPAAGGGATLLAYAGGFVAGMGLVWLFGRRIDTRWWDKC